jgi:hypothetical protein
MLYSAAVGGIFAAARGVGTCPYDGQPSRRNRWSQVIEQGSGKATRVQVAGLWIAACSLALALLRTVLEVMGW